MIHYKMNVTPNAKHLLDQLAKIMVQQNHSGRLQLCVKDIPPCKLTK